MTSQQSMPFSLVSAATATARSMMSNNYSYDNATVTTASETSASSSSLPSLCLERDLSLSSIQAENHPTIFDSLVDAERPPVLDDDDNDDEDDFDEDDHEADLMGFCDSFFSEKQQQQQQHQRKIAPAVTPSSSNLPLADRALKDKNTIIETKKKEQPQTQSKKKKTT